MELKDFIPALRYGATVGSIQIEDLTVGSAELAADSVLNSKLADASVSIEQLDTGIYPKGIVDYLGTFLWSDGGTNVALVVGSALATDMVVASIWEQPTGATFLWRVEPRGGSIRFTLNVANGTNDTVISYAGFKRSS